MDCDLSKRKESSRKDITQTASPKTPTRGSDDNEPSDNGRRKPKLTSPDLSSTQRELKKLEDYWTRNNPVPEDSPRLRSNKKVVFNLNDCTRKKRSIKSAYSSEEPVGKAPGTNENHLESLPESPLPEIKSTDLITHNHHQLENQLQSTKSDCSDPVDKNSNLFTKIRKKCPNLDGFLAVQTRREIEASLTDTLDKQQNNEVTLNAVNTEHLCKTKNETVLKENNESDLDDNDDDEYLPPRKKLRSQVTKEELWDGIPLTISFKRLAPMSRCSTSTSKQIDKEPVGSIDLSNFEKKSIAVEGIEQVQSVGTEYIEKVRVPLRERKRKRASSAEVKRSARLLEKSGETPNKTLELRNDTCSRQPDELKVRNNCVIQKLSFSLNVPRNDQTNDALMEDVIPACSIRSDNDSTAKLNIGTPDELQNNNNDKIHRPSSVQNISDTVKSEANAEFHTIPKVISISDCNTRETTIHQTISDILSFENKIHDEELKNSQTTDSEQTTSISNEVESSISTTLNEIFAGGEDITNESDKFKKDDFEVATSSKSTRRSQRLSGTESKTIEKSCSDSLNEEHGGVCMLPQSTNAVDNLDGAQNVADEAKSSKKTNIFTSNKTSSKTVPPLRIKLQKRKKGTRKTFVSSKSKKILCDTDSKNKAAETLIDTKDAGCDEKENSINSLKVKVEERRKPKKKERACTPTPCDSIALRLNNERRLSAAGSLLSNPLLNKHACVLWSSENRRHVQLSNPEASLSELDVILSKKWDSLCDKEKLRYFQRARDAVKDDNRHSTGRRDDSRSEVKTQHQKSSAQGSMEDFIKLNPVSQMTEIKKWLAVCHELSPTLCSDVINSFKDHLNERVKQQKEAENQKCKRSKQKKRVEKQGPTDSYCDFRKILFQKILENKATMIELLSQKKKVGHQTMQENYKLMVQRIVAGEKVVFSEDVRSDKLTETLLDIRALEMENKLDVKGDLDTTEHLAATKERVSILMSPDGNGLIDALDLATVEESDLYNMCTEIENLPSLSPKFLASYLPDDYNEFELPNEVNLLTCDSLKPTSRTSPVTILTDWVADELLIAQPQIGFRKAISLLSNKVVPSPTLIMPKGAMHGNKAQNCNVVFTKLKKCLPTALISK